MGIAKEEMLDTNLTCRSCGHTAPKEAFPWMDEDEQSCPSCGSDSIVNTSSLKLCDCCEERAVIERDASWCTECEEEYERKLDGQRWIHPGDFSEDTDFDFE